MPYGFISMCKVFPDDAYFLVRRFWIVEVPVLRFAMAQIR